MNQFLEVIWLSFLLLITLMVAFVIFCIGLLLIGLIIVVSAFCLVVASPFLMVLYIIEAVVRAINRGGN